MGLVLPAWLLVINLTKVLKRACTVSCLSKWYTKSESVFTRVSNYGWWCIDVQFRFSPFSKLIALGSQLSSRSFTSKSSLMSTLFFASYSSSSPICSQIFLTENFIFSAHKVNEFAGRLLTLFNLLDQSASRDEICHYFDLASFFALLSAEKNDTFLMPQIKVAH